MIQAVIVKDTNYLIPNKEHKNFTNSIEDVNEGSVVYGDFKIVSGLRKGKPFEYRLFFTKNGKILYANCIKAENVPSEIISNADNLTASTNIDIKPSLSINYTPYVIAYGGGLLGYLYGKKQKATGANLFIFTAVGAVGAYGIFRLVNSNKSTNTKPSK
jgi:hypothetical protein